MDLELIDNQLTESNKPPILFVHGMWHGAWCWQPYFLPYFAELGFKAFAFSFSCHGNSQKYKSLNLLSINDYVQELKSIIEHMETTPILIGHSMGAFVIQKYLEKYKAPKAVLITPVPPFGIWAGTLNVLRKFPLSFLKANITLNLKYIIAPRKNFKRILFSENISYKEIIKFHKKIDSESFRAYIDMLGVNLVKTKNINTPIMIIGGEKDFAVPKRILLKTAKVYGVKPIVFENMGHNIMLEPEYKSVINKIVDWIEKK